MFFTLSHRSLSIDKTARISFYAAYIGMMLLFITVWLISPFMAFLIFVLISVYHFGQQNLNEVRFTSVTVKIVSTFFSGIFVLATPLLADFNSAWLIINSILQWEVPAIINFKLLRQLSFLIGVSFGLYISIIYWKGYIGFEPALHQLLNWFALLLLFTFTPLLLSFAVYFSVWHAIPSMQEQIIFFKRFKPDYNFKKHVINIIPFSLASLIFVFLFVNYNSSVDTPTHLGYVFIFISIITIPHFFLMNRFHGLNA
jgi:Brp/Blh family beta-carotene 15,15'-monooxygenase